jgi:hypothetical protein
VKTIDMLGKRFGRLVVIAEGDSTKSGNKRWVCQCDCGSTTLSVGAGLRNGTTKSCGCLARENSIARSTTHGKSHTRLHRIWLGMRNRCYYKYQANYKDYGARGIAVCEEWRDSFEAFYAWAIANGYSENLSLDRINNDGNYEPSNCRWATRKEQSNNSRRNTFVEINGKVATITEWARISGVKQQTISYRYKKGVRGADLIKKPKSNADGLGASAS